jgi:anti-sigma factor ChrR (cupin superfamily)
MTDPGDNKPISLDDAAAAFALALDPARPRPELRERLMRRVSAAKHGSLGAILANEGKWRNAEFPGVTYKVLYFDKPAGLVTSLVRLQPGARYPAHVHKRTEQCLVLEGDLRHGHHVYGPGDFTWAEAGSLDPELHTEGGLLMLIIGAPETEFLSA